MTLTIFPIRHHGPGSARSLAGALDRLRPDLVLVEGPADADSVLPFLAEKDFKPPVALMGYVNDHPARASFWPFAVFSPEFVAFQWAARSGVTSRFMDLSASAMLGFEHEDEAEPDLHTDPLRVLAEAAGYADFERWWETLVEARRDDADVFAAVLEVMTAVRADSPVPAGREAVREAHMRQTIRTAQKEGFQDIAVVCGAWHAPALADLKAFTVKDDAALLKGLPGPKSRSPGCRGRTDGSQCTAAMARACVRRAITTTCSRPSTMSLNAGSRGRRGCCAVRSWKPAVPA